METEKTKKTNTTAVVGRRKEAVARVRISPGKGEITVNGKPVAEYFSGLLLQKIYLKPLELTNNIGKYTISAKVAGGGSSSQLEAVIHGISRALAKADAKNRTTLKKLGFLTRDARAKERRKYGRAQKARAKKQSPKR